MHYFYLLCQSEGKAYILTSAWLKTMVANVHETVQQAETGAQEQGTPMATTRGAAASMDKPLELSMCVPLFESPTTAAAASIQSFVVFYDTYLGHVALLLLGNGQLIAVNVSVHSKLCELHTHLQTVSQRAQDDRERSLALLPETLRKEMSDYFLPYRMTQTLTKKIEEGLRQLPVLEVTVENEEAKRNGVSPVSSVNALSAADPQ